MSELPRPGPTCEELAPEYLGPDFFDDPYPTYARLREPGRPIWSSRENAWFVTRFSQVEAALRSPHTSLRIARERSPIPRAVLFADPPDHTRLRSLLAEWFTPATIRGYEERTAAIAEGLVEAVASDGRMDFVSAFAVRLPVAVISEILGIPPGFHDELAHWSTELFQPAVRPGEDRDPARQRRAFESLSRIVREVSADRSRLGEGGLLTTLAAARDRGDRIGDEEFLHTAIVLYSAGHESTAVLLGNTLNTLLDHPAEFARLRAQPSLLASAIEETLRFECPVQRPLARHATADLEIGGVTIPAGDCLQFLPGAAQRDPEIYSDPDRFDIGRTPNRHLAFGGGIHFCLGAALTRMESRVGFAALLRRLPEIRRASGPTGRFRWPWARRPKPVAVRWKRQALFRALESLPVEW